MSAWNVEVLCAKCGGASCFLAGGCALEDIRQSSFLFNRSWNHAHYESLSAKVRVAVDTGRYGTAQVADAVDGDFSFSSIVWTAHDPAMVDVFTGAGCGTEAWEVGVPQDVSETGCIGVAQPIEACPTEHDVVALKDGLLFFGERITDMCVPDGRPAALSAYGLQASE